MGIWAKIRDGWGQGFPLKISREGAANVVVHPHPPYGEVRSGFPFSLFFKNSAGVQEMSVDGSTQTQDFYIEGIQDFDIYINEISIEIEDGGSPAPADFGDINGGVANGVQCIWSSNVNGEVIMSPDMKTNKDFFRWANKSDGIGTGTDVFLLDNSGGGTTKSYLPRIDLSEKYGPQFGVRLQKGKQDRLTFRVRDNLTSLTSFTAIASGMYF